ncbi:isoaspartyl peptidase/L-asparaginase family protein [Microvirga sp. BSC39]|uniref:isoaspartyl peptidase/L-asparaginase family protein n=1 Tax=Microvirga sp. BSC39 TaxID=1549810 RepID=UPI0004E8EDE5|nr:isoaspartyl peptidase/L-asparaginase family protein [Microvirga sp. BSC39]KFG69562.1 asparaginase [Microvirga sp. BSC39]
MTWVLIVHGGAKEIAPDQEDANRRGCLEAVAAGQAILEQGGSAVDAVEAAIRILESDPTFNAGYGSDLNADGEVEMDAAMMDGSSLSLGAVAAIQGVRHPISIARRMLAEPPTLLVGEGARRFAVAHGAELCEPGELILPGSDGPDRKTHDHDTVGCVALDTSGRIAAGTSTGGLDETLPGRVGDSPLPGCGFYADDQVGGVAFSGDGECIARTLLAARVMQALEGSQLPQAAVEASLTHLARVGGEAGGIVLDRVGRVGWAHNSSHFAVAWVTDSMRTPLVRLRQDEE